MVRGKKFLRIAALAMSATMLFGFAACGGGGEKEHEHADADGDGYCDTDGTWIGEGEDPALHEHTYDTTKWAFDATYHYHAATCGHDVLKDRERHSFTGNNAKCDVCDYTRSFDEIYQMYVGGHIKSVGEKYMCRVSSNISNWAEYAEKGYKLDYDEATQTWKTKESFALTLSDEVVVINVISHAQYGVSNSTTRFGIKVDEPGNYFITLTLAEGTVLVRDYGDHKHTYTAWGYDTENHWKQCADDGEKDPATVAQHKWGDDGHCTDGCGAISQDHCKHEKGFSYNYTRTTVPMHGENLKKYCPDCGKAQDVEVARSVLVHPMGSTSLSPVEGNFYMGNFVGGMFAISEPGLYTVEVVEPVWDGDAPLYLTAIAAYGEGINPTGVVSSTNYRPDAGGSKFSKGKYIVYDYGADQPFPTTEWANKWKEKITINGKPASQWTEKWTKFDSISFVVTQEDIDNVVQQYTTPKNEGEEPKPLPKVFYFGFFAAATTVQDVGMDGVEYGYWLTTITKSEVPDTPVTPTCDHEHLTFGKPATDYKDGTTETNDPLSAKSKAQKAFEAVDLGQEGSIEATCEDCQNTVTVSFTKPKPAPGTVLVNGMYNLDTRYMLTNSGYMPFTITEAGTYTLTRTAVYSLKNKEDDPDTEDKDETETYHYFVPGVFVNAGTKGSKTKADAIYYQGAWQEAKSGWFSRVKFNGEVGGTGFEDKKTDIMTITITVTEDDLKDLGEGNSLIITIGVCYGEEKASWSAGKAGHYEFVEMKKDAPAADADANADATAAAAKAADAAAAIFAVSSRESALPVKFD